ncbi:DUF1028 domain-containing protein [Ramlibacter sp. PS3R-8]|uniref:DUF1028 domain-containing protein n=1 Tax=Ramlibacter sp. PS3R-8 TaxID=3133437 RepID=UPI0030AE2E38
MTFAVIARCPRTGHYGIGQATGTPAVGTRCFKFLPGRGGVLVQAAIDYPLVEAGAALLEQGLDAQAVLAGMRERDPRIDYRQVAVLAGESVAILSGSQARDHASMLQGAGYAAAGNMVCDSGVVQAMSSAFESSAAEDLAERLMRAVEAGRDAGGQPTGQNSAVLTVYGDASFPLVDLRVDMDDEPIGELRRLVDWYQPLIAYYVRRNADPRVPPWRDHLRELGWPLKPLPRQRA